MSNVRRYRNPIQRAFTLIEILVVVVIIAILAAVVVPNVISRIGDAKQSAAISTIKSFETAIDQYRLDMGTYPSSLNDLITPPNPKGKWNGPYLQNTPSVPVDPWGHAYVYTVPGADGRPYDISSDGADGQPNTSDDIDSWNITGK